MKLRKPFAKSKNAGIQSKNDGGAKKIDEIKIVEENRSTPLRRSPVNMNNPFRKRSPAQNNKILVLASNPKIRVRNAKDDKMSIAPRTFTIIRR